jgi:hypothetical protein
VEDFKEQFGACEIKDCKHCDQLDENLRTRPLPMTTKTAVASGTRSKAAKQELKDDPRWGMKTKTKRIIAKEPFKDVSVFLKYFPDDWDMISRVAADPAHQFYNLVKDLLALLTNSGNMSLKKKHLAFEKQHGRLKDITLTRKRVKKKPKKKKKSKKRKQNPVVEDEEKEEEKEELDSSDDEYEGGAPWHISKKFKEILGLLIKTLKVPYSWPFLINFFSDAYIKIKIAEALSFLGDVGCYLVGLTDIPSDVKEVLITLIRVTGGFLKKRNKPTELKLLQKQLVCTHDFVCSTYVLCTHNFICSTYNFFLYVLHIYIYISLIFPSFFVLHRKMFWPGLKYCCPSIGTHPPAITCCTLCTLLSILGVSTPSRC